MGEFEHKNLGTNFRLQPTYSAEVAPKAETTYNLLFRGVAMVGAAGVNSLNV